MSILVFRFCKVWRIGLAFLAIACVASRAGAASAPTDWVAAVSASEVPKISGFASVQSSGLMSIAAAQPGILAGLDVLPGQKIAAGQIIARLGGPQITSLLAQDEADLRAALAAAQAARVAVNVEEQKLRQHLSTRQNVAQAASGLVAATSQVNIAQARLNQLRESIVLSSPMGGIVESVAAANGDVLTAAQLVVTIQPDSGNWLKAVFYRAAIPAGATGVFTPDGGSPVEVFLRGTLGVARPDGGVPVALAATQPLAAGAFGTVTLNLPAQTVTMIPSEALILDKGKWWVMRHDAAGDHPVQVIPGAAEGYDTVISSGLKPGDDVVAVDAYLLYNRGIAALYQPPD